MSLTHIRIPDAQMLRLRHGRRLAYNEWGDPRGTPVLYFHGLHSSRLALPACGDHHPHPAPGWRAERPRSAAHAQYLARAIPNAHLTICPGEGHLLIVDHMAEIIQGIVA